MHTRSQRARSVLTFFAQDTGTHNLVYANADVSKAGQAREVIAFCNHWKTVSGTDPAMLIMDQKVTTHTVLGELDERGITFLTLRMRSAALMKHIDTLTGTDFKTITLDRPGRHNRPKVHEATGIRHTGYPGTVRQLVVSPPRKALFNIVIQSGAIVVTFSDAQHSVVDPSGAGFIAKLSNSIENGQPWARTDSIHQMQYGGFFHG